MSSSTDAAGDLGEVEIPQPGAARSLWRTFKLGYRVEPRLLVTSLVITFLTMLPDAVIAVWLTLLTEGILDQDRTTILVAAVGLAASATLTWYLTVVNARVGRKFRDRISMAMEAHIARLQAAVPTVEHQERPEHLDRLSILRDQSFALDHLFSSLLTNVGLVFRLVVTAVLLASVHPALVLLLAFGIPAMATSLWRPGVERAVQERAAPHDRLARHLFVLATTAPPAKEVRLAGTEADLRRRRREERAAWLRPISAARWASAAWSAAAWALFGLAYALGIVWVARGLDRPVADVVLVVVAGQRLSQYVAQTVGELGFLRGVWLDASLRLTWLEDYVAAHEERATAEPPDRLVDGVRFEHVSFRYPGTERYALEDVDVTLPAGAVVAVVGENGAGKSTLVKLLAGMYRPSAGRITVDGIDLATMPTDAWRRRMAGAFQDFFRFELLARQSVGVGDHPRLDDEPSVATAVGRAGADDVVARLPSGLATQLGPTWDDGVEVSFGQWQKLALARGLHARRPARPRARRADGRARRRDRARAVRALRRRRPRDRRRRTDHRARLAPLLDGADGRPHRRDGRRPASSRSGSHDELLARGGQYADLFTIQAAAYEGGSRA